MFVEESRKLYYSRFFSLKWKSVLKSEHLAWHHFLPIGRGQEGVGRSSRICVFTMSWWTDFAVGTRWRRPHCVLTYSHSTEMCTCLIEPLLHQSIALLTAAFSKNPQCWEHITVCVFFSFQKLTSILFCVWYLHNKRMSGSCWEGILHTGIC